MANYSVRAPDGRTYQISGPAGATQAQVVARVLQAYPEAGNRPVQTVNPARMVLDAVVGRGGTPVRGMTPLPELGPSWRQSASTGDRLDRMSRPPSSQQFRPRPAGITPGSTEAWMHLWQDIPPNQAAQIYYQQRAQLEAQLSRYVDRNGRRPEAYRRNRALAEFNARPSVSALRQLGGLQRVTTTRREIADVAARARGARQNLVDVVGRETSRRSGGGPDNLFNGGAAFSAGIARSLFGLPERLAAGNTGLPFGVEQPDDPGAAFQPMNSDDRLRAIRTATDTDAEGSPGFNILGHIVGSLAGFKGAGSAIGLGARGLAATASPVARGAGNVLQSLGTLRRGQGVRNLGKLSLMGAAGGAAQSAGEGSDILRGTTVGAIAAPVLGLGFKAVQVVTRSVRDVLRMTGAPRILSRLTGQTREQISARAAAHREATGAEPTLFEILPLADRNRILRQAVVGRDNVVEQAAGAIRTRAGNLGREMLTRARAVLKPKRDDIEANIRDDLANARGGAYTSEDAALTAQGARSPTDMSELRDVEARAIMALHENTRVVNSFDDLYPSVPAPRGKSRIAVDPEMNTVLRSAAGTLKARPDNAGVTAGEITDMISVLRADLGKGGNEGRAAERAIQHLQRTLDSNAPEAGEAARRMSDAYAARSRMLEGQREGAATRLRDDIQTGTNRREARRVRNAYDTPEGAAGRTLGQGNRVEGDLGGSPEEALRATLNISRNSTGRQLEQNLGADEAAQIVRAARAQDESAQALASASSRMSGGGDVASAESLVQSLAALHPATFITTKLGSLRRLMSMTYIPESRARVMVDMLFSQNPAMMQRALNAIGNERNGASFLRYLATVTGQHSTGDEAPDIGLGGAPTVEDLAPAEELPEGEAPPEEELPAEDAELPEEELPAEDAELPENEAPPEEGAGGPEEPESPAARPTVDGSSRYAPQLQQIYDTESPELLALVSRVTGQESGGRQHGRDGRPLRSHRGATGAMQVMPQTAPAAARMAGVPWDSQAYQHDGTYNRLLGIAYLSEMLRRYDGDVRLALIAYNAGPRRADAVRNGRGRIPAETQEYLERIM